LVLAAFFRAFGSSDKVVAGAGAALWIISVWLTFAVARAWFGSGVAVLATLFYGCAVPAISVSVNGQPSPLLAICVLLAVWLAIPNPAKTGEPVCDLHWSRAALAGAACGIAVLTNYLMVTLAFVFGLY